MKRNLLFARNDGTTDNATIYTRKEGKYYASYIKIGRITKQILSGMIHKDDAIKAAIRILNNYKENALIN